MQAEGRRWRSASLVLVVARGADACTRAGLTVSRKVGSAVQRNRVKRWLRVAMREVAPPAGGPWDLVLIARPEALHAGYHALRAEVAQLFARVRA